MKNIEIKAPIIDLPEMEHRALALGASRQAVLRQTDTFFVVPYGYLKLREIEGRGGELIAYSREAGSGPRASEYVVAALADPRAIGKALEQRLGVRGRVEKTRILYLWKHTRIHLDRVVRLGSFLELETVMDGIDRSEAEAEAWSAIRGLDLDPGTFLDVPYLELLEEDRRDEPSLPSRADLTKEKR